MSYSIKNSSQSVTYLINDNTENTTDTSLTFIGKNYATYGAALNQNFLFLIENFANNVAPSNPITGQLWWDNFRNYLNVYDGVTWQTIYGASYATLSSNTYITAGSYISANSYISALGNVNTPSLRATNIGNIGNSNFWGSNLNLTATASINRINVSYLGNSGTLIQGVLVAASAAQPNITSLGTLTSLTVSGTVAAPTINGGTIGNVGATVTGTSALFNDISGGLIGNSGALLQGTLVAASASQPNITTLGTLTGLSSSGVIYANSATASSSKTSGAIVVTGIGGIGVGGRISANSIYTDTGVYYSNGDSVFGSIIANIANVANIGSPGGVSYAIQYRTTDATFGGGPSFYYYINNSAVVANSGVDSVNTTTGAIQINGGLAASGNVWANAHWGNYFVYSNGLSITASTGSNTNIQFNDGGVTSGTTFLQYNKTSGNLVSTSATTSVSTTTGAIVAPSIGVSGNVWANSYYSNYYLYANGNQITTPAQGSNTFIQFNDGGTAFGGASALQYNKGSGNLVITTSTSSTNTTSGALVVVGGVGVGGALNVGSSLSVASTTNLSGGLNLLSNGTIFTDQATATLFNTNTTTVNFAAAANVNIGSTNASSYVAIRGSNLHTLQTSVNVFNAGATTVAAFGAATILSLGATSGTLTLNNPTIVGSQTTQNLFNTTATTLNVGGAATTISLGATSGTLTLNNPTIVGSQTTQNLFNTTATTINFGGVATTINMAKADSTGVVKVNGTANSYGSGQGALQISGGFYAAGDSYIRGNLIVANLSSISFNQFTAQAPLIYLQSNSSTYNYSIGFYSSKTDPTYNHTGFVRNHLDNYWYLFSNIASEPTNSVDLANVNAILDTMKLGGLLVANTTDASSRTSGTVQISGGLGIARTLYAGSIQNTPIGNGTASSGAFTTISGANLNVTGIAAAANVITTNGVFYPNGTSFSSPPQGANSFIQFNDGGANFGGTTFLQYNKTSGNLVSNSTTTSTSSTTGAVVINGGMGVGGNIYVGTGSNIFLGSSPVPRFYSSTTPPTSPNLGDTWYQGNTDILFTRVSDGTNTFWMDITSTPNTFGNITANSASITNLTIGNATSGSTTPIANATYNLGTSTNYWNTVYGVSFVGTSTTAKYADLAEKYTSNVELNPGDVVIFGGEHEVTTTSIYADNRVAGVVSTNPAYLMNDGLENGYPIAMTGRVPCRVLGPVYKGQPLVTSETHGVAVGLDDSKWKPGCILGKSLDEVNSNEIKLIEIVVGRF